MRRGGKWEDADLSDTVESLCSDEDEYAQTSASLREMIQAAQAAFDAAIDEADKALSTADASHE